jgi:protein phosphatase
VTLQLRYAALSDVGRVRRDNQDSGYAGPHLLVIADGVGGAARGDIASSAAVEAIRKLDTPPGNDALSELAATLHLAHDRLAEIVEQQPDLDGTSTTVTAAVFDGTHLRVGHVGDSRGYLLRDGELRALTTDHTLVQSLIDEGRITEDEARVHPHRNRSCGRSTASTSPTRTCSRSRYRPVTGCCCAPTAAPAYSATR